MTSYIYFIQADIENGPIKIGFTADDPARRMVKIQSDCPWPVKLLGAIRGSVSQEKQIHLVLSPFRTQGEWFTPHPLVLGAVREALKVGERLREKPRKPRSAKYNHPVCRYRSKNGLTLKDVACRVGISHASLSRIEAGKAAPGWDLACRLSKETGIHVRELRRELYDALFPSAKSAGEVSQ